MDWIITRTCDFIPSEIAFVKSSLEHWQIVQTWAIKQHDERTFLIPDD